jgi:hypothetical protein
MRLTWRANMNDRALGRRLLLAPYRSKMTHKALNSLANVFPYIPLPSALSRVVLHGQQGGVSCAWGSPPLGDQPY